jgi:hypothetical protein
LRIFVMAQMGLYNVNIGKPVGRPTQNKGSRGAGSDRAGELSR